MPCRHKPTAQRATKILLTLKWFGCSCMGAGQRAVGATPIVFLFVVIPSITMYNGGIPPYFIRKSA